MNLQTFIKPKTYQKTGKILAKKSRGNGHLLKDVTLRFLDKTTHLDYLWIGSFGILGVVTSDYSGELYVEPKEAEWFCIDLKGKRTRVPNVLTDLEIFREILTRLLPKENLYRVDVNTALVFGRNNTKGLNLFAQSDLPLMRLSAFEKMLKLPKFLPGGSSDADKLLEGLKKYIV